MKRVLFLAMLCCMAFASQAQVNSIINRTSCPVRVTQMCYTPPTCMKMQTWVIVVPPGAIIPMPGPACPPPQETSYRVCWGVAACANLCVEVAGQVPPPALACIAFLPLVAPLPGCALCNPVNTNVSFNPINGNLTIQ